MSKVAIIGAGLSGLNCAKELSNSSDLEVHLYDRSGHIGGRVQTTELNGYLLDEGFQILLPSYPEVQRSIRLDQLGLQSFLPGACIYSDRQFYQVSDPLRDPTNLLQTLFAPIGSLSDKLKVLGLKSGIKQAEQNLTFLEFLKSRGFSEQIINKFFIPFFSGVFLDPKLDIPAHYFHFLYQNFSKSKASLPQKGMGAIAQDLFDQCKDVQLKLNSSVEIISSQKVRVSTDEMSYQFIVDATSKLNGEFHSVVTDYFVEQNNVIDKPSLILNANRHQRINHIAPLSLVQPSYVNGNSSEGELLSVNLIGSNIDCPVDEIKKELGSIFPAGKFEHLKRVVVNKALPKNTGFGAFPIEKEGVYFCGDFMQSPSINGALASGRYAAEAILSKVN